MTLLDRINKIDLSEYVQKYPHELIREHLLSSPGQEAFKLYAYISSLFSGKKIADIGTRYGNSALALSYGNNIVDSYDINKDYFKVVNDLISKDNIQFFLEDITESKKLLDYYIISLDIDPHSAEQEEKCLKFLIKNKWDGILLLDDIGPSWPEMNKWWNEISVRKYDLTKYGHASGTGLIDFSNKLKEFHD